MKTKILSLLFLFVVTVSCAQGIVTPFDQIKLRQNQEKTTATRVLVQDAVTGNVGWVLKSSLAGVGTPTLQLVTDQDNHLSDRDILMRNTGEPEFKSDISSYYLSYFKTGTDLESRLEPGKVFSNELFINSPYSDGGFQITTDTRPPHLHFVSVDEIGSLGEVEITANPTTGILLHNQNSIFNKNEILINDGNIVSTSNGTGSTYMEQAINSDFLRVRNQNYEDGFFQVNSNGTLYIGDWAGDNGNTFITLDDGNSITRVNSDEIDFYGSFLKWNGNTVATYPLTGYPANSRTISTTAPLTGGGDLSANRTLSMTQSNTSTNGWLSSTDWNTFNNKQAALGFTAENSANKENTTLSTNATKYPTVNLLNTVNNTLTNGKIPYTGATTDVNLGNHYMNADKGFSGTNASSSGDFKFGEFNGSYNLFYINSTDVAGSQGSSNLSCDPSGGFSATNSEIDGSTFNIHAAGGEIALTADNGIGGTNNLIVVPTQTSSKLGYTSEYSTGAAYLGTPYSSGATRQLFFSTVGDGSEFSSGLQVRINSNIEEGNHIDYGDSDNGITTMLGIGSTFNIYHTATTGIHSEMLIDGSGIQFSSDQPDMIYNGEAILTSSDGSTYVQQGVDNSTTVVLTSATLNSTYPFAATGFRVYCTAIVAGKMVYEKTPSGWIGTACIVP